VGLTDLTNYERTKNLDFSTRLGEVADRNNNTLALIGHHEARLERTYYRALHELQRLRKEREAKLALVCESAPEALPSQETNNIQPPAEPDPAPEIPTPPHKIMRDPPQPASPPATPSNL
jgi:hypothetical protein